MSAAGGDSSKGAVDWPLPEPFDQELLDEEEDYWAKRSKSTLGWPFAPDKPGANPEKPREGAIAVKNRSSKPLFVVVCTGKQSLFPVKLSVSSLTKTSKHADLKFTAAAPTPKATVGAGYSQAITAGTEQDWVPLPDEEPRIITAERVLQSKEKQIIGVGPIKNVYLHVFFDYNATSKCWGKKVIATPILPFRHFYNFTDTLLDTDFCKDAALNYEKVMQDLPDSSKCTVM